MLYYRDWLVVVAAAGVIAVHHLLFNYLQAWGYPVYLFSAGPSLMMVVTHAAYVIFESALLIYMSIQGAREAVRNVELQGISLHFDFVDGKIDLTYRKEDPQSEFAHNFNGFMQAINQAMSNSLHAATKLISESGQLQSLSDQANEGTKQQQHNTAQVASAINEMAASIQAVAQNTKDAANAAEEANKVVSNGSSVVNLTIVSLDSLASKVDEALAVIQKLESHTADIGMVLEVIKGIADQTNLLALNAAIEAARAGEQGRGFAVVADEVRTLASRTQQSTEEIQKMIELLQTEASKAVSVMEDSSKQTHEGVKQASLTKGALGSIAETVTVINDMNSQIAFAAEQQSVVIEEINRNIIEINEIAEDTANGADSMVSSCQDLVGLSGELKLLVDKFSV